MDGERGCGSCGLCCKLLAVEALAKPAHQWCSHFEAGAGCGIYAERPQECRTFRCLWLTGPQLGDEWQPNRSRIVLFLTDDRSQLIASVDPAYPDAWRKPHFHQALRDWSRRGVDEGLQVLVKIGQHVVVVLPDRDIDLGMVGDTERLRLTRVRTDQGHRPARAQGRRHAVGRIHVNRTISRPRATRSISSRTSRSTICGRLLSNHALSIGRSTLLDDFVELAPVAVDHRLSEIAERTRHLRFSLRGRGAPVADCAPPGGRRPRARAARRAAAPSPRPPALPCAGAARAIRDAVRWPPISALTPFSACSIACSIRS